jgi:hypothetical protein
VIGSRRLIWVGHLARMKEDRSAFKILTGKLTENRSLRKLLVDGRKILEQI